MYPPLRLEEAMKKSTKEKEWSTSSSIDWMSVTFPYQKKAEDILPQGFEYQYREIKSPIPVYETAFEVLPIKAKLLMGAERLGKHLILSGKAMNELRQFEVSLEDLWVHWQKSQAKLSRIDLAVDVFEHSTFSPKAVEAWYFSGYCDTKIRRNKTIAEDDVTETFYIGDMKSKNVKIRFYDKAIEQGIPNYNWCRIELEKRKNAQNWGKAIFEQHKSIKSMIRASVDFPQWLDWLEIMGDTIESIPRGLPQKPTDNEARLAWIINSVLPALARTIIEDKTFTPDKLNIQETDTMTIFNHVLEGLVKKQLHEAKVAKSTLKKAING